MTKRSDSAKKPPAPLRITWNCVTSTTICFVMCFIFWKGCGNIDRRALTFNPTLTELNLGRNKIGDGAVKIGAQISIVRKKTFFLRNLLNEDQSQASERPLRLRFDHLTQLFMPGVALVNTLMLTCFGPVFFSPH